MSQYSDPALDYLYPDQGASRERSTGTTSGYSDPALNYLYPDRRPATDDFDKGVLGGGFYAGANALGSIFGGLASATGDVFNWDNMQRWGAEVAEKYGDYAAEHGRDIPSLEQVFESDEAFTDFARWAGFNVTSGVTTALPGLAAAALGAIAGPVLGVGAGSAVLYGMGVGDITASQLEGKDDPDVRWALAGGVPYAVAERMFGAGAILARRLTGRQKRSLATSYLKRMASDVPFAMGSEATAEGVQTILTEGIRRLEGGEPIEDVIGDKNFWKAVGEASAAGAVAGAPFGAVGAIQRPRQETAGGERRGKAQPTAGLPPQQPGAATSPDQATPPAEQMLSDEDRASPLPDADIAEGRRIIDEAVGSAPANGVLDTVGYPHIGTKVTVSSPDINDGQPFQGTISDGMEMEPGIVAAAVTDDETGIVHYIDSDSDAEVVRVPTEEEKQAMADDSRVAEEYQEVVRQAVEIQQAHILHEELRRENSDTFDAVPRERRKSLVSAIKARVDQERKNQEQVVKDVEQAVKEDEKAQQEAEKQAEADAKEFDDRLLFVDKQEELREQTDADLGDGTYTEHMRDVLTEMGVDTNDADGFDSVRADPKRRATYDKLITSRIRRTRDRRKKEEETRRQEDKQAEEARERSRTEAERRGIERKPGQSFDDWWNGLSTADRRLVASTAMYGGDDLSYLSNLKGDLPQGTKSRLETEFPPMDQEGKETVPQDDGEFTKLQGRIGRVDDQDIPTWWDSLSQEDKHQAAVAAGYINGGLDEIVKTAGSALRTADVSTFDRRFPPFARVPDTEPDTGPRRLTAPEESEPTPEPTPEPKAEKTDYKEVIRQLKEGERTKPTEAEQLQPLPPTRPLQEGYNAEFYTKQRTDDGNFRRVKGKFVGAITTDQGDTHHFMLYHKGRGEWHVIHAETGLSAARGSTRHKALHDYQRRSGRSKSEKANFSRGLHNVETLRKDGELINQHLAFADEQPAQEPTKVDEKQPTETKAPATEPKPKKTRQPKTTSPLKVGDDAEYVVVGVDRRKSRVKGSYAFSWTAPDGKVHHFMVRQAGPVRDASGKGPNVNWVVEHAGTGANMYWNDTGKDNTKEDAVNAVRERVNSWGTDETRRLNRWFESFADINQNLVFADEQPAPAPEPEATPKPEPKDPEPKEPEPKDKKPKEPEDRLDWARILPDPADAKALENLVVVRFHGPEEPVMLKQWDADVLAWLLKKLPEVKDAETYVAGMPKGTEELHYRVRVHFNSEGRRPRALQRSFTVVEIKKGLQDQLKAWRDEVRNRHPLTDDEQQELVDRVTTWLDEARNTAVTKEPKPKETDEQTEETTDEETVETEEDQTTQDDDTTEETEKPKDVDEKPKEKPKDKKPKEPEKEPAPTPEPEKLPKTRPLKMGNRAEYFIRPDPNKPEVMHKVKGSLVYTWVDADGASHPFMAHKEEDGWEIHHVGTGIRAVGARTKSQSRQSVLELLTTLLGHKDSQRKHTDIAVATEAKLGTINEHLVFADGQPTQVKRRVVKEDDGKIKKTRPLKAGYKAQYFVRRSDKNLEKVKGEYVGSWTAPDGKVHHFMAHYMGDDLNKGVVLNHVPTWRIDHAESGFMVNSSPWYEKAKTDFRDRFDDPSESESQRYMKTLNKPLEESGTINQHLVFADEEPVEPTTEPETQPTKRYSISDSVVDESNLTRRDHARINQALKKVLDRIAPNVDKLDTSGDLLPEGATGFADYFGEIDGLLIALAVRGTSNKALLRSMQTLGHESIHALRFDGLFTLAEWQTLKDEADKQGWIEKYRIPERYPDLFGYVPDSGKTELLYEEAIAEAFGDFLAGQIKTSPESHHLMLRIWYYVKQLAEAIRKRVMDLSPETRKVFTDIAEGVVGERYKPDSATRKEAKARRETEQDLLAYSAAVDTLDEKWLESYGEQFADVYDLDVHSFSQKMLLLLEEAETDGLLDPMGWLEDAVADLPEAQRAAFQHHWNQIAPEMALERRESRTRARTKPTTARLRKIFEDLKPKPFEPDENAQPFEMTEDEELYYDYLEEMAALGATDDDNRPHREAPMRPDASPNTELEEIQAEIAAEDARTKRPSSPTKPVISDADLASMNRVMTRLVQGDPRKQRNDARINQALKKALKRIAPNVDRLETDPAYVKKVADRFRPESDVHGFMDYFVNFDGALIAVGVRSHPNNIDLWNAFKTLGHEAIHALRKDKLFTDAEWETLKDAAWDEKWFERYGIRSRYPEMLDDLDMPTDAAYEEAIAEAFGEFWAGQLETKPEIKSLFVRLWDYVTQLAGAIRKKVMALPPDARKVFTDIAEGVVGERFDPDSDTRKEAKAARSKRTSSAISVPAESRRYKIDDNVVDESKLTGRDRARIGQALQKVLDRIAPNVDELDTSGDRLGPRVAGFADYFSKIDGTLIAVAVRGTSDQKLIRAIHLVGHEAIHALRFDGLFTDAEWNKLKAEVDRKGWFERYEIRDRYPDFFKANTRDDMTYDELFDAYKNSSPQEMAYEEAIADAFGEFLSGQIDVSDEAQHFMLRLWEYVKQLAGAIRKRVMDLSPEARTVFTDIAEGVIGERYDPESETRKSARAKRAEKQKTKELSKARDQIIAQWDEDFGSLFNPDGDFIPFPDKLKMLFDAAKKNKALDPKGWFLDAASRAPDEHRETILWLWGPNVGLSYPEPIGNRRYSRETPGPKPYRGGVVFGDERADQDWQKAILGKDAEKQPFMRTLVDYINHFGSLWVRSHRHLPRETRFADAHAKLRIITAAPSVATENIVRYLHDLVKDLSQTDLELLTFKAIADDFQHDVAKGLEIPFFADHAEFQKEYGRINATMAERPDLMKRVHKRRRVVNKLKNEMIEWGLLTKEQATNPTYFRHQVLEYAMVSNAMGLNTSRNVRKPHYFERKGTRMVINARLVEVESEWMFRAMVGVESMKQLDALQKRYDEAKSLRAQIRMENRALIEEAIVREYSKRYGAQFGLISSIADIQELLADTDIDGETRAGIRSNLPLYNGWMLASRYIGMGINTMQRDENFKVSDVPKSMADMFESIMTAKKDKTDDAADYMPLVAWLAQNGPEDAKYTIGARSMLKGIGQRRQFMKDTLGKQYVEPSDLDAALKRFNMDDEYRTWQIEPGNTMFWASTVPERVIEHFMVRLEQIQKDMVGKSPDKIDMTPWGMSEVEWLMGNIRQQLVMGGKKPQMVLPIELADTLDDMGAGLEEGPLGRIVSRAVRMHKQWLLINPRTWFRYNLQNMTGDLDGALAAFPKSLNVRKYINPAIDELWKVQIKREKPSERYMEAARRGVFDAGWSINEVYEAEANIGDVLNAKSLTQAQLRRVWRFFSRSTTFRENWLRYAMFMAVEDAIKRGETELPGVSPDLIMATVGYGAAKRQIVDATTDRADRAALIARESIGDYGDISVAGEYLRKRWLWFWSWQEINFKRYMRLASNAWAANDGFGKTEALTKIGARVGLRTSIWMFTRATIFLAMVHLWNHLFFPDEEEELSREDRWRLHVILGRDPTTGKIIQVRAPGALSDFLSIFGYEDIIQFITETQKGRGEWSEVAQSVALAPVNRVAQGLTPMIKAPAEALSGNSFFPKFWEPRTIKDPMRHALRSFRLEHEYDALLGRPSRGYFGSWAEAIVARRDPGENAYQYIRGLTFDFMRTQKGRDFRSQSFDDRSRAIYYWRKAIRFEDDAAAKKFRAKMTEYGVKPQNVRQIMKGMHPLGILGKNDRRAFMQTLTAEEKERVSHAIAWYRRLFE